MGEKPLWEAAFAELSPLAFYGGVGLLAGLWALGEAPGWVWLCLYPWWRLRLGWRAYLYPGRLILKPPLGLARAVPLAQVEGVEVGFWPAGPLARGRRALFLLLANGERLPLPLSEPEALAERLRALLEGRTSGSGSPGG
ncbi:MULTISPECIES: hypothetical protein [Thermus]|uniref:hypothetical protein n=1 Tax=Thermus sp. (strain 2.9) TaxID=1577051 RepID=UPI0005422278|nr:hypothetical protein [Thermus sp. 2.9]KHG65167.1 hypothetical protein QT17_08435 [Thermus sp. 2.9]